MLLYNTLFPEQEEENQLNDIWNYLEGSYSEREEATAEIYKDQGTKIAWSNSTSLIWETELFDLENNTRKMWYLNGTLETLYLFLKHASLTLQHVTITCC